MTTQADEYQDTQACPGCDRQIPDYHSVCPHCKYDIDEGKPAAVKQPKQPKEPKEPKRTKVKAGIAAANSFADEKPPKSGWRPAGRGLCHVPALGRMARPSIDFPALHWPKGQEPTDDNLREWAETLRNAWSDPEPHGAGDTQHWLSNHAIGYLATHARSDKERYDDKVLVVNASRIVALLGGDDW